MSNTKDEGKSDGTSIFSSAVVQAICPIKLSPTSEATIGTALAASQLPSMMGARILGHVAPTSAHKQILATGLKPRSMAGGVGLTPPIGKYETDAIRRIYLGGFFSSSVYSNINTLKEQNVDWLKTTKNFRFQCAFLFQPTISILKYPLIVVVPENFFIKNFTNDEYSIVKILREKIMGVGPTVSIPGAYKSKLDVAMPSSYFVGSPKMNMRALLWESMTMGTVANPIRAFRGATLFSIGASLVVDARKRFGKADEV